MLRTSIPRILVIFLTLPLARGYAAPGNWWEEASAILRVSLQQGASNYLPLKPSELETALDRIKSQGFSAIEVFAPAHGGKSYHGLDALNRYQLDPAIGTMDDFRRLVRTAHAKGLRVVSFDNLGYLSVDSPDFLSACDSVRASKPNRQAGWFLWSDSKDAPAPPGDRVFAMPGRSGKWEWSERAGRFYWAKWQGVDAAGKPVTLPQYNWASTDWQQESEKVLRFWLATGIDGLTIDAVNWYVNYGWETGRRHITSLASGRFLQPEGAGGFHDDPEAWISEGGWNCVQDYAIGIWWERWDLVRKAIETGDPRPIEAALRGYHDRVVAAGGVLYHVPAAMERRDQEHLSVATIAAAGDLVSYHENPRNRALRIDEESSWILKTKASHAALHQLGTRRALPTSDDTKFYAFLRTSRDARERMLVVLNFQPTEQTIEVDLSGLAARSLTDVRSAETFRRESRLTLRMPAYGYRFLTVNELPGR